MLRAPGLHDGGDVESEQLWAKKIALLHTYDGQESLHDAVYLELDEYVLVQRDEQGDDRGRHTVLEQHLPQELPRHAVKSLDQVQEQYPRLLPVFATFGYQLSHCVQCVSRPTLCGGSRTAPRDRVTRKLARAARPAEWPRSYRPPRAS